jgi:hypothetical protein
MVTLVDVPQGERRHKAMTQIKTALQIAAPKKEAATAIKSEALSPELIKAVAAMVMRQNAEIASKQEPAPAAKPLTPQQADVVKVAKKHIDPIEITIKLTASRVSASGTLSGFEIDEIICDGVDVDAFAPRMQPHAIMLKVESLDGLKIREVIETGTSTGSRKKLF